MRITRNVKLTDSPSFKLTTVLSILDLTLDNGTVLTAVDVQTGLATSCCCSKQRGRQPIYSVAELKKFIYETGRTYGILQYDKEPALKALVTDVSKELGGMSIRATPKDWKQAHGSIGKMQQTLFGQSRTLRLQLQERIRTDINSESLYLSMDCETLPILTESLLDS